MIISRQVLQRLSPSIREATPEPDDAVVRVAPSFSFVGLPPEPLVLQPAVTGTTFDSSFGIFNANQVAAAAAVSTVICLLNPGFWDLFISAAYRSNYTVGTFSIANARVSLVDPIGTFQAIVFYASSLITTQQANFRNQLLIRVPTTVRFELDANIATQEHSMVANVMANRLL